MKLKQILKEIIIKRRKPEIEPLPDYKQFRSELKEALEKYKIENYDLFRVIVDGGDNEIPEEIEDMLRFSPFYEENKFSFIVKVEPNFNTPDTLFFKDVLPTTSLGILIEALVKNGSLLAVDFLPSTNEFLCIPLSSRQTISNPLYSITGEDLEIVDKYDAKKWKTSYYDLQSEFEDYQDKITKMMEYGIGVTRYKERTLKLYWREEIKRVLKYVGIPLVLLLLALFLMYYLGIITVPALEPYFPTSPGTNSTRGM